MAKQDYAAALMSRGGESDSESMGDNLHQESDDERENCQSERSGQQHGGGGSVMGIFFKVWSLVKGKCFHNFRKSLLKFF